MAEEIELPEMKETPFSSHVGAVGYKKETQELFVNFRGRIARYKGVPEGVAESVMEAPSIGQGVNLWIRGNYEFDYVTG